MTKLLFLSAPVIALVAGIAAGDYLRPASPGSEAEDNASLSSLIEAKKDADTRQDPPANTRTDVRTATFTFPSQFFVPLMRNGDMGAMMILTLSVETAEDQLETMKQQEHRLRDALLRQLLIHANTGGFDGNFTTEVSLRVLRESLLTAARQATTLPVRAVLIEDIARQAG
ncbi:hypothetical protein [Paracoccus seriniphilus]|uniref:hypothetical protein n=1 Tax=Paracoccus seriniphilus TaxID=184748 RepID=UPI00356B065D